MIHQAKGEEPHDAFRFNASRWDAGSGTYDMGFRNYDPGLNRFLTRDAAAKLAKTGKKIADGIDTVKDVEKGVEATVDAKALPTNTPKPKTETPTKPKCNSFVPGTRVLLSDGSSKPIEEV
ncbi:RHS repeat-associated core domain-containing protein, partial [Micromonospora sp. NPDC053811]